MTKGKIPIFPTEMEGVFDEMLDEMQDKRETLLKNARPREELIVAEIFDVQDVGHIKYEQKVPRPSDDNFIGIQSPGYDNVVFSALKLSVIPIREIPARTLIFPGNSPVRGGDKIVAYIPRYDEKTIFREPGNDFDPGMRTFYVNRGFKSEERVIKIEILNSEGKVVRTD